MSTSSDSAARRERRVRRENDPIPAASPTGELPFASELPFARPPAPWAGERGLSAVLGRWRSDLSISNNLLLQHVVDAREASVCPIPAALHPTIVEALHSRGIDRLYAHQARAFESARSGRDIVIATPTASGKSLCYQLAILDALAREPDARALFLFPTKALARDQEDALRVFLKRAGIVQGAITYDGDTPGDARRAARERSGALLTNPDMLHAGILPHHANWARFFSNLRYVVIDELHTYRGVFGSHLANVLRRLDRIARFHGSTPVFISCSATIGNPAEHAARMLGREIESIDESGAPSGERHVLVYNPPIIDAALGMRASYLKSAVRLAGDLLSANVPTLVFGQSRNTVEIMLKYLRDRLAAERVDPESIQAYRSGYLPETRRRIERGLRDGSIRGVVSTNALELGIDIGSLQAVVCAGYPGTMASLWQRFGRAGRRSEPSLALLVTSSQPLDQFVARTPQQLVSNPIELARIDPDNLDILIQHLKCASFELPFERGEALGDVPAEAVSDALDYLAEHRVLLPAPGANGRDTFHWSSDAYPATHVSLRSASWDNFVVIDLANDETIAEMDWRATHTMLHVQAIYQHEGDQYQVERLDFENHKAYVRRVEPDYYTTALTYTSITVLHDDDGAAVGVLAAAVGDVSVVEKVVGYKKIKFHTHENVGYGDVRLPDMEKHTSAFWVTFSEELVRSLGAPRASVVDSIAGIGNAMHVIAAIGLMCDPQDLGHAVGSRNGDDLPSKGDALTGIGRSFDPTLFLYDQVPGGTGLAPRLFQDRDSVLRRVRMLIEGCPCEIGCPGCIGAVQTELDPRTALNLKKLAIRILDAAEIAVVH